MDKGINSLIEVIYHREKEVEEQTSKLSSVQHQIYQNQEMILRTLQRQQELREKIDDQGCRLQEEEARLKCWAARQSALQNAKSQIAIQRKQVEVDMDKMRQKLAKEYETFNRGVEAFLDEYDLTSDGLSRRKNQVEIDIEENRKKKEQLELELSQVRLRQACAKDLQWTLDTTKRLIKELERRRNELEEKVGASEARVLELMEEKQKLMEVPQTGSEYLQLQAALRASNVAMKRDEYIQLQEQLAELRRNVLN